MRAIYELVAPNKMLVKFRFQPALRLFLSFSYALIVLVACSPKSGGTDLKNGGSDTKSGGSNTGGGSIDQDGWPFRPLFSGDWIYVPAAQVPGDRAALNRYLPDEDYLLNLLRLNSVEKGRYIYLSIR